MTTRDETREANRTHLASIARDTVHQKLFIINLWRYVGFYGETDVHPKAFEKTSSIVKSGTNFN